MVPQLHTLTAQPLTRSNMMILFWLLHQLSPSGHIYFSFNHEHTFYGYIAPRVHRSHGDYVAPALEIIHLSKTKSKSKSMSQNLLPQRMMIEFQVQRTITMVSAEKTHPKISRHYLTGTI